MKKIAMLLAIILLVATPLSAQATTLRSQPVYPNLSFTGSTANCSVTVLAASTTDEIELSIALWYGRYWVERWDVFGNGIVNWEDSVTVTRGNTYTLTVDVTINGEYLDQVYITETCP